MRARYFSALDDRDFAEIAAVFAPDAEIAMGDWGVFHSAQEFVQRFEAESSAAHLFDLHHGANHVIDLLQDDYAVGRWDAHYVQVDAEARATFSEAYAYTDEYRRENGRWLIVKTEIRSLVTTSLLTRTDGSVAFDILRPE